MRTQAHISVTVGDGEPYLVASGQVRKGSATEPYEVAELLRQAADDMEARGLPYIDAVPVPGTHTTRD